MNDRDWIINAQHLQKRFGSKLAVKDISLQVRKGEVFGFLGPNGSGKTTTIRMLCGLLTPDGGTGQCLGYDIISQAEIIKTQTGYMTQHFSLYGDLSIQENLNFIARIYQVKERKKRVQESLERLGLMDRAQQLAQNLSGGWKQRLALAATLIHDPKLLFLDEPTAGVDPQARRDFWDDIHQLAAQGVTALVSTHYMDEAERCNRLGYIANGELLTVGTLEEIIAQAHLFVWAVTGPQLFELEQTLRKNPAVVDVSMFGNMLHVCGYDQQKLADLVDSYRKPPWQWKSINASLEDVFINLVSSFKKRTHQTEL